MKISLSLAELEARGIAFVSLRDNLDLGTPSGRLMFQIIGAMAEFERALIQERVRAGLRNARAKGKHIGRPRLGLCVGRSDPTCEPRIVAPILWCAPLIEPRNLISLARK